MVGSCEYDNEPLDSIKYREFLDLLRKYLFLKTNSVSWNLGNKSSNR